jgi:AbrB family looped-hinge helix DNA binding protein
MPEGVREKANISVGDKVNVRYEDGKIILEKNRKQLGRGHERDRGQLG